MIMDAGTSFLIPSGPEEFLHLCIICTGKSHAPDHRLLVNISSIKEGKFFDETCIIEIGEHPFVKCRSYVAYQHADQKTSAHILRCIEGGLFIQKQKLSTELLERITTGFNNSKFVAPWVKDFI